MEVSDEREESPRQSPRDVFLLPQNPPLTPALLRDPRAWLLASSWLFMALLFSMCFAALAHLSTEAGLFATRGPDGEVVWEVWTGFTAIWALMLALGMSVLACALSGWRVMDVTLRAITLTFSVVAMGAGSAGISFLLLKLG